MQITEKEKPGDCKIHIFITYHGGYYFDLKVDNFSFLHFGDLFHLRRPELFSIGLTHTQLFQGEKGCPFFKAQYVAFVKKHGILCDVSNFWCVDGILCQVGAVNFY